MKRILLALAAAALFACHPLPPIPPGPSAAGNCQTACANLARLGCYEGQDATCTDVCTRAQDTGLTDLKPACLTAAATVEAARACGTISCTNPE